MMGACSFIVTSAVGENCCNMDQPEVRQFPPGRHEDILEYVLTELELDILDTPFRLPRHDGSYASIAALVDQELKLQSELIREELCCKVHRSAEFPRQDTDTPEKHLKFPVPYRQQDGVLRRD